MYKTGLWGTFVHIDIFRGLFFGGGVLSWFGFSVPLSPPTPSPSALRHLLFVAILFKFCGFSWTSQLSSVLNVKRMPEVGVDSETVYQWFFSTNTIQLLSWKVVHPHTLNLIPCSTTNTMINHHIT